MIKNIFRLFVLSLIVVGWGVAALALHVVRTPDPNDPGKSKFVIVPKERIGIRDTYVDARKWTLNDVADHAQTVRRVLATGQVQLFKYLADPKNKAALENQIDAALARATNAEPATTAPAKGSDKSQPAGESPRTDATPHRSIDISIPY